jgi:hypothetical protein
MIVIDKIKDAKFLHEKIFWFFYYFAWFLYGLSIFGITSKYVKGGLFELIQKFIRLYISLLLIIKFNPFIKNQKFTEFDKEIAFQAGVFIFTTTLINQVINHYFPLTKDIEENIDDLISLLEGK